MAWVQKPPGKPDTWVPWAKPNLLAMPQFPCHPGHGGLAGLVGMAGPTGGGVDAPLHMDPLQGSLWIGWVPKAELCTRWHHGDVRPLVPTCCKQHGAGLGLGAAVRGNPSALCHPRQTCSQALRAQAGRSCLGEAPA